MNLADIYQVIEQCSEEDLFVVFKVLDASKTGRVTLNDFIGIVGSPTAKGIESINRKDSEMLFRKLGQILETLIDNFRTV